jgi:hypothetical protein
MMTDDQNPTAADYRRAAALILHSLLKAGISRRVAPQHWPTRRLRAFKTAPRWWITHAPSDNAHDDRVGDAESIHRSLAVRGLPVCRCRAGWVTRSRRSRSTFTGDWVPETVENLLLDPVAGSVIASLRSRLG